MESFDVVIIGSGPGGYVAAIRAAQLGLRTAIVEKDKELGGTCLNIGCIPSKALLSSSDHFFFAKSEAAKHGIKLDNVSLDLPVMLQRKDKVVKQLTGGVRGLMKLNKVSTFSGMGTIPAPGKVSIQPNEGDAQEIEAKHIIIATGSVPVELPSMKFDGKTIVSSTEALSFSEVPKKLLVIGGGAIGLEMGSVWSRLGAEVTVVEFLPRIALGFDLECANALQKVLTAQGMKFHLGTKVGEVKIENGRATATATKGEEQLTFDADKVLVSVGRRPFAEGVGADKLGVEFDERKRIKVDAHFRTNIKGIYAIGDVTGKLMLAHTAEAMGVVAAETIAGAETMEINFDMIPRATFCQPQIASFGYTEAQAKEKGYDVKTSSFPFSANGKARGMAEGVGFVKIVADAEHNEILGAHLIGPEVTELLPALTLAQQWDLTADEVARNVFAHPTLSEAMKEAIEGIAGHMINL